jgi:hypothetical protein
MAAGGGGGGDSFPPPLLTSASGRRYDTLQSIVEHANHLEHFHVYDKPFAAEETTATAAAADATTHHHHLKKKKKATAASAAAEEAATKTLDYHTDAGLFLAFVPAMDCASLTVDTTSFYLQHDGPLQPQQQQQRRPVDLRGDEVVVMLGAAAERWLRSDPVLRGASHALSMRAGRRRAWYGKMHMLPGDALLPPPPQPAAPAKEEGGSDGDDHGGGATATATFGELLSSWQVRDGRVPASSGSSDGCSAPAVGRRRDDASSERHHQSFSSPDHRQPRRRRRRRRLQHVGSPAECNNVTNFFCWYQCLDIPNPASAGQYAAEGYSLYCLDPAVLANSGNVVSEAAAPCEGGYNHNSNCLGSWQPTAPSLEGYPVALNASLSEVEEQFCYGGTSMYMDGFQWVGTACIIYLFPAWVLSTPAKLVGASIGSFAMSIVLERVLFERRRLNQQLPPGYKRLAVSALTYGVQLTMGYFIMLVVMTYSGPLFLSTILGFVLGHVLFNAQDALLKTDRKKSRDGSLPKKKNESDSNNDVQETKSDDTTDNNHKPCCHQPSCECPPAAAGAAALSSTGHDTNLNTSLSSSDVPEGVTPCCQNIL